jgi:hypothetical protein
MNGWNVVITIGAMILTFWSDVVPTADAEAPLGILIGICSRGGAGGGRSASGDAAPMEIMMQKIKTMTRAVATSSIWSTWSLQRNGGGYHESSSSASSYSSSSSSSSNGQPPPPPVLVQNNNNGARAATLVTTATSPKGHPKMVRLDDGRQQQEGMETIEETETFEEDEDDDDEAYIPARGRRQQQQQNWQSTIRTAARPPPTSSFSYGRTFDATQQSRTASGNDRTLIMTQHQEERRIQAMATGEVSLPMGGRAGVATQSYDEEEYPQDEVEEEEEEEEEMSTAAVVRRTEIGRTRAETRLPNGTIKVIEEVEYDDGTRQLLESFEERIGGGRGWRGPREDPPEH